jgi:diguanylate cyclase
MSEEDTLHVTGQSLEHIDALTGLPNRRWIDENLTGAVEQYAANFGVILIDLDGLKEVNDTKGHAAGDELIMLTASTLQSSIRSGKDNRRADSPAMGGRGSFEAAQGIATRLAGDEFIVIITGTTSYQQLSGIGQRLQTRLANSGIEASIGAAQHAKDIELAELLHSADKRMYENKLARKFEKYSDEQLRIIRAIGQLSAASDIAISDIPTLLKFLDTLE